MGPKIEAAISFVENGKPGSYAAIGDLKDAAKILTREEGTIIKKDVAGKGVVWRERAKNEEDEKKPPKIAMDPPKYG